MFRPPSEKTVTHIYIARFRRWDDLNCPSGKIIDEELIRLLIGNDHRTQSRIIRIYPDAHIILVRGRRIKEGYDRTHPYLVRNSLLIRLIGTRRKHENKEAHNDNIPVHAEKTAQCGADTSSNNDCRVASLLTMTSSLQGHPVFLDGKYSDMLLLNHELFVGVV